ncbi:MAG: 1-phosphofructokinase family hexose kinase [Alphaproteobacteria bacterium]
MKPIVTLTLNPCIDASSETDDVRPMSKNRISNERFDPGGGGINVARVVKELGGSAHAIYLAGGLTGHTLDKMIDQIGLPRTSIQIRGDTRISHTVFERSTRKEYRFVPEGPAITEAEWQACLAVLEQQDADYVVASGSLPHSMPTDFYARVARIAAKREMRLVLDTSGEPLHTALAEGIYLLKPNRRELADIAGMDLSTRAAQHAAAMAIIEQGHTELVAVSLGSEGAFVADRHGCFDLAAPPAVMHSAVGAGDSFVAGMTLGLVRGRDVRGALRLAVAAGTAAIMTMGTELCRRADVERLDEDMARDVAAS